MTDTGVSDKLLAWYDAHARDLPWRLPPGAPLPADPAWPYRVWLSEIMLQQTTVAAVVPYFAKFTARWPGVADLAAAGDAEVMSAWAGLGYYARARNLLACARAVVDAHGGCFPDSEAALRTLPGIGAYTAAAIAAIAFGHRAVVVDGNVERVVARLEALETPIPAARPTIRAAAAALTPATRAGDHAQAMMDLGSRICTPRAPRCAACPLANDCRARERDIAGELPRKAARTACPVRHGTAWWIEAEGKVLTVTRPAKGLLGGMAALPSSGWGDAAPAADPPHCADWRNCGTVTHAFTHFELRLRVLATVLPVNPAKAGAHLDPLPRTRREQELGPRLRRGDELAYASIATRWHPIADLATLGLPTLFAKAASLALAHPIKDAA